MALPGIRDMEQHLISMLSACMGPVRFIERVFGESYLRVLAFDTAFDPQYKSHNALSNFTDDDR